MPPVRLAICFSLGLNLLPQSPTSLSQEFEQALALQQKGDTAGFQNRLQSLVPRLREAHEDRLLTRALSALSQAALAGGHHQSAIRFAGEAVPVNQRLHDDEQLTGNWNTIGTANSYAGAYPAAIAAFEQALAIDRRRADREGQIVRLYNIGNVYFEQGRYQDAYRNYRASLDLAIAGIDRPAGRRRKQIAAANLAILYQRLGRYQQALDLYLSLEPLDTSAPRSERAQLLANKGATYRRLGDPVKALEIYREAQKLFAEEHHPYGEVGVLKNIGIVLALDLNRRDEALDAFTAASYLAEKSVESQIAPTRLFLAEALRQMGRMAGARRGFQSALEAAQKQASKEYQWRAQFGLGQLAEQEGVGEEALRLYRDSIHQFESLRSGLDMQALKRDFLADKREVYDAALALLLNQPHPDLDQVLAWMESSRSRILQDSLPRAGRKPGLKTIQERLDPGTVLLEFWNGPMGGAVLCLTRSSAQLLKRPVIDIAKFRGALVNSGTEEWRGLSVQLGESLLSGLPALRQDLKNVIIVPDGALSLLPFEAMTLPGSGGGASALLVERAPVFYAPSAGILLRENWSRQPQWRAPWSDRLLAFADPLADSSALFPSDSTDRDQLQRLPKSVEEVRYIAGVSAGRAEVHIGAEAKKEFVLAPASRRFPILHLSTHAVADTNDPERSRILLAPASRQDRADFLFLREIYSMDFRGVDLVVLSACDTETGKLLRGEGIEGFSKAFVTAGAASVVTTLWRVDDDATAEFMKQFYFHLGQGESKSAALRNAKRKFVHSGSRLQHPRYWAAFVLNGDGFTAAPRYVSWAALSLAAGVVVALAVLLLRRLKPRVSESPPD